MIPKVIHYVFLVNPDSKEITSFSLMHYLCIRSFHLTHPEFSIKLHYNNIEVLESSKYFNLLKTELDNKLLLISYRADVLSVYKDREVKMMTHRADILKYSILYREGGIYSDLDALIIKPLDPFFGINKLTMANEVGCSNHWSDELGREVGLCPGFMISPRGSKFIDLILEGYSDFDYLNGHKWGIQKPVDIYYSNPDLVNVIHQEFFNYPLYYSEHLRWIFEYNLKFPKAYILHLWESQMKKAGYMELITEEYIRDVDSTFNLIARKYLP